MDKFDLAYKLKEKYSSKSAFTIIDLILENIKNTLTAKEYKSIFDKYSMDKERSQEYNGTVVNNILYKPNEYKDKKALIISGFLGYLTNNQINIISKTL